MKLKKIIATASLAAVTTMAFAPAAMAAGIDTQKTAGSFSITEGKDDQFEGFLKPGTYGDRIGMDTTYGKHGVADASLRFNWIPNFSFGTIKAKIGDQTINSVTHQYTYDNPADPQVKGGNIYQFMQVQDLTGKDNSEFKVTMGVDNFKKVSDNSILKNTRMRLLGLKTTNNLAFNPDTNNQINKGLLSTATIQPSPGYLQLNPGEETEILKAKASTDNSSSGSVSSVIFNSSFDASQDPKADPTDPTAPVLNDQVQLFVPSNEVLAGDYTATITWTLHNTL